MKRKISACLVFLVIFNLLIVVTGNFISTELQLSPYLREQKIIVNFNQPEIIQKKGYDFFILDNCSYISDIGAPMLPIETLSFYLPDSSKIIAIKVETKPIDLEGEYEVLPVPIPTSSNSTFLVFNPIGSIYKSDSIYPEKDYVWYESNGLNPDTEKREKIVTVNVFPMKYIPLDKKILFNKEITVTISYSLSPQVVASSTEYIDNLIITSSLFVPYALELAEWKNYTGIQSLVLDTDTIYTNYAGIDNPEKIRNCIKDYVSEYDITYVTIFGDVDQVPIRYAYVPDPDVSEYYIPTDLYYADLDGTWDDNLDGVFADQEADYVDGIPDVYVGRIPASLVYYAEASVDKIIGYEQQVIYNPSPNDWTQKIIFLAATCSGDGFSNIDDEGFAILKDHISNYMSNNEIVKLYEEYDNLTTNSLTSELNQGSLFVNFAGHGSPGADLSDGWLFDWVSPGSTSIGYGIPDVESLVNGYKLPVVTAMSCSTARLDDVDCLGEVFVVTPNGGGIAYIGATRIAYGYFNELIPYHLMGAMDNYIYQTYFEGKTKTGQLWGDSIKKYMQSQVGTYQTASMYDAKTLMETILLGDPTINTSGDLTPPVTTINYDNLWHTEDYYLLLVATDIGVGVKDTYYQVNGGPIKQVSVYGQPLITNESAYNYIEYWSVDEVENEELPHKILNNIKLDKSSPVGFFMINNGSSYTNSETVSLSLNATDLVSGVIGIRLSNDGVFDNELWEDYVLFKNWNLSSGEGSKIVYYQLLDQAGLLSELFSNSIIVDKSSPYGFIEINNGALYTNNPLITLSLTATDTHSSVELMSFSNDNISWTDWELFSNLKLWNISKNDGLNTVYAKYRDVVENIFYCHNNITLDTISPNADIGPDIETIVGSLVVFDALNSSDDNEIDAYFWDFGDNSSDNGINTAHIYSNPGNYTVMLFVQDQAGNTNSTTLNVLVREPPSIDSSSPSIGEITSTNVFAGNEVELSSVITDDVGVDFVIPSWNNTGTWVNHTAIDANNSDNFIANYSSIWNFVISSWNNTETMIDVSGAVVSVIFYANDTSNNWSTSEQFDFILELESIPMLTSTPSPIPTFSPSLIPTFISDTGSLNIPIVLISTGLIGTIGVVVLLFMLRRK